MPKKQETPSSFATYFLNPQVITLSTVAAFCASSGYILTGSTPLLSSNDAEAMTKNYGSLWATLAGTFGPLLVGSAFSKVDHIQATIEDQHKRGLDSDQQAMNKHYAYAESCMVNDKYFEAANHFSQAAALLKGLYSINEPRSGLSQLYSKLIYQQAHALYNNLDYDAAKSIITQRLIEHSSTDTTTQEHVDLLNLRGLIHYKISLMPINHGDEKNTQNEAKADFETSYGLSSAQNGVNFYINYLRGNYALVDDIPIGKDASSLTHGLPLDGDKDAVFVPDMLLLFGKAFYCKNEWAKAISIFEYKLDNMPAYRCNKYIELFLIRLDLFESYTKLLLSFTAENITQFRVNTRTDNGVEKTFFIEGQIPRLVVQERAIEHYKAAQHLLDSALLLNQDQSKLAQQHKNHGYAYQALATIAAQYNSKVSHSIDNHDHLTTSAEKHFHEATTIQEAKDALAAKVVCVKANQSAFFKYAPSNEVVVVTGAITAIAAGLFIYGRR